MLFYLHGALLLVFGVILSAVFSGIRPNNKNMIPALVFCAVLGLVQIALFRFFSEQFIWQIYPLIAHLPTVLFLVFVFKKELHTAIISVLVAYLFCQPAKWAGVCAYYFAQSSKWEYVVRIITLLAVGLFSLKYAAPCLRGIFNKDARSVMIFAIVPASYYLFDYFAAVYTNSWLENNQIVIEFLPLLLCFSFLTFCMVYYQEHERKADAERKEQVIRLVAQQQTAHIEKAKQVEQELRVARHDMRHFLNQLAACIDADDIPKTKELLHSYINYIDGIQLAHYCDCDTVNYVLSAFSAHCTQANIQLHCDISLDTLKTDELLFCSILQNALDNAYNAQLLLPPEQRNIWLLLKTLDGKLLLSVKNPTKSIPNFVDGLPVSSEPGHGYGTQSIRYLSERFGGNCQFSMQNNLFVVRVLI